MSEVFSLSSPIQPWQWFLRFFPIHQRNVLILLLWYIFIIEVPYLFKGACTIGNHVPWTYSATEPCAGKPTLEWYQSHARLKEYQSRVSADLDGFCLQQRAAMMLGADLKGKPPPFFSGRAQEVAMKCTLPPHPPPRLPVSPLKIDSLSGKNECRARCEPRPGVLYHSPHRLPATTRTQEPELVFRLLSIGATVIFLLWKEHSDPSQEPQFPANINRQGKKPARPEEARLWRLQLGNVWSQLCLQTWFCWVFCVAEEAHNMSYFKSIEMLPQCQGNTSSWSLDRCGKVFLILLPSENLKLQSCWSRVA